MVRCVNCPHFNRQTRYCSFYKQTISVKDIYKNIQCNGYPNRAEAKVLLNSAHVDAISEETRQRLKLVLEEAKP